MNQITYIKHKKIDFDKYDTCVKNAINTQLYAFSWYLDCVADDWDILVLGDYEIVMPVPFLRLKRHLFLKKIYQPAYCQQLGVFSKKEISQVTLQLFFDKFISLHPKNYNFNRHNSELFLHKNPLLSDRTNYELKLVENYPSLSKNYSTNLKRNLSKANKNPLFIKTDISISDFIALKKLHTNYKLPQRQLAIKKNLLQVLITKEFGNIVGVYFENKLIAACFLIHYNNKIINLTSATDENGKKMGAISFLFDHIIKENAQTNKVFDFEGSMIPGVARFFKSFGAEKIIYKSLGS